MKKIIGLVLFLSVCAFAGSGGDSLKWSTTVSGLANGDTFDVPKHWKSMIDTVQSIINGRLGNVNLSASAKFDQRKIDSTQTISTDWIYNYTRKILKWNGATPEFRNGRGWAFRINDTTANTGKFTIYADSTKMLLELGEDTLQIYRPLVCSTDVIARHNLKSDDSLVTKGIRATASIRGDSLISDKGIRITNTLNADSAYFAKDIKVKGYSLSDSIVTKGLRTTATSTLDSINITKGLSIGGYAKLGGNSSIKFYSYRRVVTAADDAANLTVPQIPITTVNRFKVFGIVTTWIDVSSPSNYNIAYPVTDNAFFKSNDSLSITLAASVVEGDTMNVSFFEIP